MIFKRPSRWPAARSRDGSSATATSRPTRKSRPARASSRNWTAGARVSRRGRRWVRTRRRTARIRVFVERQTVTTADPAKPTLVILAAGIGRRYGNDKQIAPVGPDGEWLLEYAVRDALAADFAQVVMVIRAELRECLHARLAPRLEGRASLHLVEQTFDAIPAGCRVPSGRSKPLGTGHALWCCAP